MSRSADAYAYRPVTGPTAFSGDWRRFLYLATTLAVTDWKLRFFGSALGYLWSLVRPLLLFGIMYVVFSQVFRVGDTVEHYPELLLLGIVLFTYFAEVTGDAVSSIVDREALVRKIAFPRMVIPLAIALTGSFNLLFNLVAVTVFIVASGVDPSWTWLLVFPVLVVLVVLTTGVAMLVSVLFVPFRDVRPIWAVAVQALFYATPIFWTIELLGARNESLAELAMMNPLAVIVQAVRYFVVGSSVPSPTEAIGGAPQLLIPLGVFVLITGIGFVVFKRMAPHVAERL